MYSLVEKAWARECKPVENSLNEREPARARACFNASSRPKGASLEGRLSTIARGLASPSESLPLLLPSPASSQTLHPSLEIFHPVLVQLPPMLVLSSPIPTLLHHAPTVAVAVEAVEKRVQQPVQCVSVLKLQNFMNRGGRERERI
jgi:hypothetical protein